MNPLGFECGGWAQHWLQGHTANTPQHGDREHGQEHYDSHVSCKLTITNTEEEDVAV